MPRPFWATVHSKRYHSQKIVRICSQNFYRGATKPPVSRPLAVALLLWLCRTTPTHCSSCQAEPRQRPDRLGRRARHAPERLISST